MRRPWRKESKQHAGLLLQLTWLLVLHAVGQPVQVRKDQILKDGPACGKYPNLGMADFKLELNMALGAALNPQIRDEALMADIANIGVVEILSVGISGFAFLLLLFAYSLASQVQQRILEVKPDSMESEKLDVWSKLAERQLVNTRYFMACAFAFVLAGIYGLTYQSEAHFTLSFMPSEAALKPTVRKNSDKINISDGAATVKVKSEQTITIENTRLFEEIQNLRTDLAAARSGQHTLSERTANLSPNAGFGSLKVAPK